MGINCIDHFLSPWIGEVQEYLPQSEEISALHLPADTPDFAVHDRWYHVTLLKRGQDGQWVKKKEEQVYEKKEDGSFEYDGDIITIREDGILLSGGEEYQPDDQGNYPFHHCAGYRGLYQLNTDGNLVMYISWFTFLEKRDEDWSYNDEGQRVDCHGDFLSVDGKKRMPMSGDEYALDLLQGIKISYTFPEVPDTDKRGCAKFHDYEQKYAILDEATGDLYRTAPVNNIRLRCFEGLFLIPVYITGIIVANIFIAAIDPLRLPVLAIMGKKAWKEIPLDCVMNIWNIVRPIIYVIPMGIALGYGLFYPLEGRAKFAEIEALLKSSYTYKDDFRYAWKKRDALGSTFFMLFCFQKIGNIYNDKVGDLHKYYIYKNRSVSY